MKRRKIDKKNNKLIVASILKKNTEKITNTNLIFSAVLILINKSDNKKILDNQQTIIKLQKEKKDK